MKKPPVKVGDLLIAIKDSYRVCTGEILIVLNIEEDSYYTIVLLHDGNFTTNWAYGTKSNFMDCFTVHPMNS